MSKFTQLRLRCLVQTCSPGKYDADRGRTQSALFGLCGSPGGATTPSHVVWRWTDDSELQICFDGDRWKDRSAELMSVVIDGNGGRSASKAKLTLGV